MPKAAPKTKIDLNPEFQAALEAVRRGESVFITGKAGTGKSTLLKIVREELGAQAVVVAPTGVAALNVGGETIHAFFRWKPGITVDDVRHEAVFADRELYRNLQTLIIDEISMVRADLMDCMDVHLQTIRRSSAPFGGVQLVLFGDLHQLPPVISSAEREAFHEIYGSPFFFSSCALHSPFLKLEIKELQTIYRQRDKQFIQLLNAVRNRTATDEELKKLNARVQPIKRHPEEQAITLTTTNVDADHINRSMLAQLPDDLQAFGAATFGSLESRAMPAEETIELKTGARVMFVANDPNDRFVNGSMGRVIGFKTDNDGIDWPIVKLDDDSELVVEPHTWEVRRTTFDKTTKKLKSEILGSFRQLPLRLAWAVTIHKSQGKTFDQVIIDLGRAAFAHGQTYVALSRCTSFKGVTLARPIRSTDLKLDEAVGYFLTTGHSPVPPKPTERKGQIDLF
jgi:ATP-dependent DNA helicase PIF1